MPTNQDELITDVNAREFFQGEVESALQNQHLQVSGETVVYLGNLLTAFIYSDYLYEYTQEGPQLRPLAMLYKDAHEAPTRKIRCLMLRRLGDVSLFISGMFARSLSRSLVDIDYYIAMGGNAYGYLSEASVAGTATGLNLAFSELAGNFPELTDVLSEVGDSTNIQNNHDVLRQYEIWIRTGSTRAAKRLKNAGIHPVRTATSHH